MHGFYRNRTLSRHRPVNAPGSSSPAAPRRVALAALLLGATACGGASPPPVRSALLVTIDTLRQDHLACYGGELETPALDELAAGGFRFTDAFTTAPTTLPSHTSLLTGTYPHRHGVRRNGLHRAPPELTTLAEAFRADGHRTAAFVGTAVLDAVYGLDQGFELYDDSIAKEDSRFQEQRRARSVVDAACSWLRAVDEPFFLWVHVFDPHGPYDPPAPFDRMYYEGDERDPRHASLADVPLVFYQDLEGVTDLAYPLAQYKAEISYTDDALAALFEALGPRRDETAIVVTADHGESFGEEGVWFDHGETLSDACVRVPLVVRAPWIGAGRVLAGPVSHVDVAPTLRELCGLGTLATAQGTSLVGRLAGAPSEDRFVFFETFLPSGRRKRPLFGVRSASAKATLVGQRARLFDDQDRPTEEPERLEELRAVLSAYAAREPDVPQEDQEMTPEQEAKLRALGYGE